MLREEGARAGPSDARLPPKCTPRVWLERKQNPRPLMQGLLGSSTLCRHTLRAACPQSTGLPSPEGGQRLWALGSGSAGAEQQGTGNSQPAQPARPAHPQLSRGIGPAGDRVAQLRELLPPGEMAERGPRFLQAKEGDSQGPTPGSSTQAPSCSFSLSTGPSPPEDKPPAPPLLLTAAAPSLHPDVEASVSTHPGPAGAGFSPECTGSALGQGPKAEMRATAPREHQPHSLPGLEQGLPPSWAPWTQVAPSIVTGATCTRPQSPSSRGSRADPGPRLSGTALTRGPPAPHPVCRLGTELASARTGTAAQRRPDVLQSNEGAASWPQGDQPSPGGLQHTPAQGPPPPSWLGDLPCSQGLPQEPSGRTPGPDQASPPALPSAPHPAEDLA
ncbi:basic salivary proline-rich protein 1-like [Mesoplodon densirostris]|uniref:basic salivary proline-rich protein 1-like n=1 Tax=Mesoplodon densirostris TaxID=48708 RepID=UPI0028DC7BF5|nr:basic salivary proline-rich protein 1-like [Mesoplodon densirostris]